MVKINVIVYGCTASKDEGNIIRGLIIKEGYKLIDDIKLADVIVIVSCIVKTRTESRLRSKIKEILSKYPNKKLIIAGCMPEAMTDECRKIAPNASLINTFHTTEIINVIKNILKNIRIENLGKRREPKLGLLKMQHNEANVQIAQGCMSQCHYCIVRLAKGRLHSFSRQEIVKEIEGLVKKGHKRINITATDCGCYGFDNNDNIVNLLRDIVNIERDFVVRLGMMNPSYVIVYLDELIEVFRDDKIMNFLHIPAQSFSDKILKDMNRNYNYKNFKKIVTKFRKEIPEINISTDLIVGYPTETEEEFALTLKRLEEINPEVLNISKFGPRKGTESARLKQLPSEIVKKRSVELNKVYKKIKN